jgi:hypothetical protein
MEFRHASGVKPSTSSTSGDNTGRFNAGNPYVAEHIAEDRLCEICNTLDFKQLFISKVRSRVYLQRWRDVKRSHDCPFCRLVAVALRDLEPNSDASRFDSKKVYLQNKKSWKRCITSLQYDGPESEEYSNMYDLRSQAKTRAKRTPDKRAYRLLVSFGSGSDSQRFGEIQYLADEEYKEDRQFFGRRVDRQRANIPLIQSWFHRCQQIHGRSCEESGNAATNLPWFRVIDVHTRNVIVAPANCRYVALSYVWGRMKQFVARESDFKADEYGREYLPLPERLTRTISDAFFVVKSLGERYLWVDALCIMQDSRDDRHHQMMRMDAIYSSAALTIVAASGRHSNVGLPGISIPRQYGQHSELVRGFRFAVNLPSYTALEQDNKLIWNSRGWTFQEKIMSKRLLLFTDYQAYFRCSNMVWCEDVVMETEKCSASFFKKWRPLRWAADRAVGDKIHHDHIFWFKTAVTDTQISDTQISDDIASARLLNYASAVTEFTQRTLSQPKDRVYAISGVLETLKGIGPFYQGIPDHFLDVCLLWHAPTGGEIKRRPVHEAPFSSWTWASWKLSHGCTWITEDIVVKPLPACTKWIVMEHGIEMIGNGESGDKRAMPARKPILSDSGYKLLLEVGCLLYFQTMFVQLRIGERSRTPAKRGPEPSYDCSSKCFREDHASQLYELVDRDGIYSGEVWMSRSAREECGNQFQDFITLSWEEGSLAYKSRPANMMLVRWKGEVAERIAIAKVEHTAWCSNRYREDWVFLG